MRASLSQPAVQRHRAGSRQRGHCARWTFGADQLALVLRLAQLLGGLRRAAAAAAAAAPAAARLRAARRAVPADPALLRGLSPPACTTASCAPRTCPSTTRRRSTARALAAHLHGNQPGRWPAASCAGCGRADRWMRTCMRRCTATVPALLLSGSDDPVTPPAVRRAGGARASRGTLRSCWPDSATGSSPRRAWAACWRSSSTARDPPALDAQLHGPGRGRCPSSVTSTGRRHDRGRASAKRFGA